MCELTGIVRRMGNPFFDDGEDLITLDIKLVMDSSVVHTLKTAETIGQVQYDAFVQERLVLCEKPLTNTMPKNNLSLLGTAPKKVRSRSQHQVASKENQSCLHQPQTWEVCNTAQSQVLCDAYSQQHQTK